MFTQSTSFVMTGRCFCQEFPDTAPSQHIDEATANDTPRRKHRQVVTNSHVLVEKRGRHSQKKRKGDKNEDPGGMTGYLMKVDDMHISQQKLGIKLKLDFLFLKASMRCCWKKVPNMQS